MNHQQKLSKPLFVISAVNLTEAGPLSILRDATYNFIINYLNDYKLVLLINNVNLLKGININEQVELKEYKYPKKSWMLRLWFEYVHSWFISKRIKPAVWFSLHDITPNVLCTKRVVYCHNPSPFYKLSLREMLVERSLFFFNFFYSLFYNINIKKNQFVVVQQQWMRDEFIKRYNVKNVVVAYPDISIPAGVQIQKQKTDKYYFLYPSLPRVFKNFEVLLKATELLEKRRSDFEVVLTFDGSENRYAKIIKDTFGHLSSVKFIGIQKRQELMILYQQISCVVFASKMETWGLPISEAKLFNKPLLVADEKYTRETVGEYDQACFFEYNDAERLADLMEKSISGQILFDKCVYDEPEKPFAQSWRELYNLILSADNIPTAQVCDATVAE